MHSALSGSEVVERRTGLVAARPRQHELAATCRSVRRPRAHSESLITRAGSCPPDIFCTVCVGNRRKVRYAPRNKLPRHRLAIPCQIATPSPRIPNRAGTLLGRSCGSQATFLVDLRMFCYLTSADADIVRPCRPSALVKPRRSWASAMTPFAGGSTPGGCPHQGTLVAVERSTAQPSRTSPRSWLRRSNRPGRRRW